MLMRQAIRYTKLGQGLVHQRHYFTCHSARSSAPVFCILQEISCEAHWELPIQSVFGEKQLQIYFLYRRILGWLWMEHSSSPRPGTDSSVFLKISRHIVIMIPTIMFKTCTLVNSRAVSTG